MTARCSKLPAGWANHFAKDDKHLPAAITFPVLLKQCRLELGLTQTQLAVRAGISVSLVRKYETGARVPPRATAVQLANALGLAGEERAAFLVAAGARSLP